MKLKLSMLVLALFMLSLTGCGPAAKAIKRGDALAEMQDNYGASQEYLTALNHESDNNKAKLKLCQSAKPGYEQKFSRAERCEKDSDFECALKNYQELSSFLNQVERRGCLSFGVGNMKQKIAEMKAGASESYYSEAEKLFNARNFSEAVNKYTEALRHNNPYKDSTNKIAESHYQIGLSAEKQKSYRAAAGSYKNAIDTVTGYKDATMRATTIYEALGDHYLAKKQYRNAYNDYNSVKSIDPQYANISDKLAKAEDLATTKIAFIKVDNRTGRDIAGASLNDLIGDEIQAKLKAKASHFLHFMDRDQLESIFAEQKMGMTGLTDEYSSFKKLKGVDSLIFGKINQVNLTSPPPKAQRMVTQGSKPYGCIKTDKKGRAYETTCYQNIDVNYQDVSASIALTMGGAFKVLKVASGEQLVTSNFSISKADSVSYATDFSESLDIVSNNKVKERAAQRKDLSSEDQLMKQILDDLTTDTVNKILGTLDATPSINDPVSLALRR